MEVLENMCRICLCVNAKVNLFDVELIPLFGMLADKFVICTQVKISIDDSLPKYICEVCVTKLNEAFGLREMAQDSDKELRRRLNNIKNDIDDNMKYEEDLCKSEDKTELVDEDAEVNHTELTSKGTDFETLDIIKVESTSDKEEYSLPKSKTLTKVKKKSGIRINNKLNKKSSSKKKTKHKTKSLGFRKSIVVMDSKDFIDNLNAVDLIKKSDGEESVDDLRNDELNDLINQKRNKTITHKTDDTNTLRYCTFCDILFQHKHLFRRHMRVEHKLEGFNRAKDYMCDVCGNTFHDQYGLEMHKRSHTGDRPFTCNVCGQGFTQQSNMERHVSAKHEKVKPFQCEICSKHFAYSTSLRDHKRRHSGQLNYQCSICSRKFARNYTLVRHQLTHTHARPYVCKHCDHSYTQSNDLKTHVKKTHPGQPVERFSDYCVKHVSE